MKRLLFAILLAGAALFGINHIESISTLLKSDPLSWKIGNVTISAFSLIEIALTLLLVSVVGMYASKFFERRVAKLHISSNHQELLIKFFHIFLCLIAFFVILKIIGIDITSFMVFGSAVFVGIGLGLQKMVANFIAGIALLFEKSFEIGDVLELEDGTAGVVRKIGARYTLLETFGGKDIMIPNDDFFIRRVVNWTHSSPKLRVEVTIKVHYKYDMSKICALIVKALEDVEWRLQDVPPACQVKDVIDGVVIYSAMCWIPNASGGVGGYESEARIAIWTYLKSKGVGSAMPQREVHMYQEDS
jgi:small-conductance mechanosensitive channel